MEKMDKFTAYINNVASENKANKLYYEFLEAIKTQSNKIIETSKVFLLLEKIVEIENDLIQIIEPNEQLFRGRLVSNIDELPVIENLALYYEGFDNYDSKEPPLLIGGDGRCNTSGMSYLYVSENEYVAAGETRPERHELISIAAFRVKRKIKIINFCDDVCVTQIVGSDIAEGLISSKLITKMMRQFISSREYELNYRVTQYITDYFRKAGFDGFAYRSSQTNGKCYVVFNSHSNYIEFLNSEIYFLDNKQFNFVSMKDRSKVKINNKSINLIDDASINMIIADFRNQRKSER